MEQEEEPEEEEEEEDEEEENYGEEEEAEYDPRVEGNRVILLFSKFLCSNLIVNEFKF